jgi:hypothetical protein
VRLESSGLSRKVTVHRTNVDDVFFADADEAAMLVKV